MDNALIQRYAPGGDIYQSLAASYGTAAADRIYVAAQTGDRPTVTAAIAQEKYGNPLTDSTAAIFAQQVVTDPLAAPAEALNSQIGKAFANLFKSPWILVVVVGVAFFYLGGGSYLKGILAKRK